MNADFDPVLLSALLDGELSPEEAAIVRQRLAESETLMAEFASLESLSKVAKGIPSVPAPKSLLVNVLDAIPEVAPAAPAPASPAPNRGWMGVAGGLVAALALCVVVVISNDDDRPERGAVNVGMRSGESAPSAPALVSMESADSGMVGEGAMADSVTPDRELEPVVDTGFIQQEVELVRVRLNHDDLHQRLASAELTPKESSDAPRGYRAFVVEGSREQINDVLRQFQEITGDRGIEIDRHNVPGPIIAEFEMEAQQKRLIALADRGPASKTAVPGSTESLAPAGGGGFAAGSGLSSDGGARLSRSGARSRGAAKGRATETNLTGNVKGKDLLAKREEQPSTVLFFYKLPSDSGASRNPCEGA